MIHGELIRSALRELLLLAADESCDHEVNICWCSTFETIEALRLAILKSECREQKKKQKITKPRNVINVPKPPFFSRFFAFFKRANNEKG